MKLAAAPAVYDQGDQARVRGALSVADLQNRKRGVSESELLLSSPNGTVWRGTIDNSGVLSWTALP